MVLFWDRHWRSRLSVNACMCCHLAEPCRLYQMVPDNYNLDGKGLQTPTAVVMHLHHLLGINTG